MAQQHRVFPPLNVQPMREGLALAGERIKEIEATIQKRVSVQYNKVNMDPVFEGGGFFCKRDRAAVEALYQGMRDAFFAGFKRSDNPPPPEAKIEAAFIEWLGPSVIDNNQTSATTSE